MRSIFLSLDGSIHVCATLTTFIFFPTIGPSPNGKSLHIEEAQENFSAIDSVGADRFTKHINEIHRH
jgi:hypothetical protein